MLNKSEYITCFHYKSIRMIIPHLVVSLIFSQYFYDLFAYFIYVGSLSACERIVL